MKLLVVTRESSEDKCFGLGRSLRPVLNEIKRDEIEVRYLCLDDAGQRSKTFLQFLQANYLTNLLARLFRGTDFPLLLGVVLERVNMGRLAAKVMTREGYTHVHCHDPFIAVGYRLFSSLSFGHKARWGLTEHGFGSYSHAFHDYGINTGLKVMRCLKRWESRVLLSADWVISPTWSARDQLSRDLSIGTVPDSWHVIYHSRPRVNKLPRKEARRLLGWDNNCLYIIAVGQFIALKQFEVLIKACASLRDYDFRIVLIGHGDQSDILRVAKELKLDDRLHFTFAEDMGLYYSAADIYCSTSRSESFGLANLEAISLGLPAICTAVGGVPEVVGTGAWLIPTDNDEALTMALQSLLDHEGVRADLSARALSWTQGWPDSAEIAEMYMNVYQGGTPPSQKKTKVVPVHHEDDMAAFHQQVRDFSACPLPGHLLLPSKGKILVVAPHADDETLGCGGTLHLLKEKGNSIKIIVITDGAKGDPRGYGQGDVVKERIKELKAAMLVLGIGDIEFMSEPDGEFSHSDPIQKIISGLLREYQADWLFLPSILDYHRDHVGISLSWLDCWQKNGCYERLFLYEVWQPLPATWLVDISDVVQAKEDALKCFKLPLRYYDYLSLSSGLSSYRGTYLSKKNCHAEAFLELKKETWKSVVRPLLSIRAYQDSALRTG